VRGHERGNITMNEVIGVENHHHFRRELSGGDQTHSNFRSLIANEPVTIRMRAVDAHRGIKIYSDEVCTAGELERRRAVTHDDHDMIV
jgi:hypothetical protein